MHELIICILWMQYKSLRIEASDKCRNVQKQQVWLTHLSGVWVPAQDPVVFAAAQQELWIGLTPRDGQNPSGALRTVCLWRPELNESVESDRVCVHLYLVWFSRTLRGEVANRRSHICMTGSLSSSDARTSWVATSGCHNIPEQCIWHTSHSRFKTCHQALMGVCACSYPVAVVADFDDGLVLPQIPDHGFPAGVSRRKYVRHLTVPRHHAHVLRRLTHDRTSTET